MAQLLLLASAGVVVGTVACSWMNRMRSSQWVSQNLYHVTLAYNKWRWPGKTGAFNIVHTDHKTGHRIVLSRIPDDDTAYLLAEEFKFEAIFSCVQDELEWAGITTSYLVALGLIEDKAHHYRVPMTDFCAEMDKDSVANRVKDAFEAFKRGDILVHCKAGRSRSALFVAILLVCLGEYKEIEEAVLSLLPKRTQVNVEQNKQDAGKEILANLGFQ